MKLLTQHIPDSSVTVEQSIPGEWLLWRVGEVAMPDTNGLIGPEKGSRKGALVWRGPLQCD